MTLLEALNYIEELKNLMQVEQRQVVVEKVPPLYRCMADWDAGRMTKPKFRPCPSCQVRQQANRKTCSACFATLPSKRFLKTSKMNDDWGQRVIKNKNASRVVASAQIAVQKLSALGYMPILFINQRHKGTGKLMADVVTHLPPTQNNTCFITSMKRAYDFIIKLHGDGSRGQSALATLLFLGMCQDTEDINLVSLERLDCGRFSKAYDSGRKSKPWLFKVGHMWPDMLFNLANVFMIKGLWS
ncbi:hypothetical protein DPX16_23838 [Anabarilius grahami]|uniref:Uncharacterized protein n=1 Tax=Anabarilius grahami TaxID=495550 RepID=A0A3N0XUM1_ANAGA|nr:hypothetical protein DPX16_23838 [Anabarilius grahami]